MKTIICSIFLFSFISMNSYGSTLGGCLDKVIQAAEDEISKDNLLPGVATYYALQSASINLAEEKIFKVQFETSNEHGRSNRVFEARPTFRSCHFELKETTKGVQ